MEENIMQNLERILGDKKLYNCDKIEVRMNWELYGQLRVKFGTVVEDLIRTGIMLGKRFNAGRSVDVIYFMFSKEDLDLSSDYYGRKIDVKVAKIDTIDGKSEYTAFVTISFKK